MAVLGTEPDMELKPATDRTGIMSSQITWVLAVAVFAGTVQVRFGGKTYQLAVGENRAFGEEQVARVGDAGSYRLTRPQPCKPLPGRIHKTENVPGAVVTNQWWSSLLWQQKRFGQPLFAHPLVATCSESGLAIGYPGAMVHGNNSGIFGGGVGRDGDLKLGHSAAPTFRQVDCDGYSDWFVAALFTDGQARMRVTFGHGSPFVYCLYHGGNPTVSFTAPPRVWSGGEEQPILGVTIRGHHYGLFGPAGSRWSGLGGKVLTNEAPGKGYFSVALLPDNRPETLGLFHQYAHHHVTDTRLEYKIDGGVVKSTYRMRFKRYEGDDTAGTLVALYPHQWRYTTTKLKDMTYGSIRGTMRVCAGESFATEVPVQGVLPMFPPRGVQNRERMIGYLKAEAAKKPGRSADTYWEGKFLGRLATLSGIAEAVGDAGLQRAFVDEIKRRLESWFTATAEKERTVFYYNAAWGTLIGSPPSYGSDLPLNDHHFHYGYFIRAAAEVARVDGAWARKWGPMVELLIREIASPDRRDPLFPYLRCFDKYAGHSWASGDANFGDGNNQESSSESLNAWYGMTLWGQATGDTTIRDTGLFLYNTERTAIEEYWFDVSGKNFPKDYPHVALGMIWGGKGAFATWFSGDIDCIHGINWLPFTPASVYMGRHPDYVKKNFDRVVARRRGGEDFNTGWGDLVVMFGALSDPAAAAKYIDAHPDCRLEGGNSHAFMYHWIYTLRNLGRNDAGVTADYPIQNVFRKNGAKTYLVYNYHGSPLTVRFSDGKIVQSTNKGLTMSGK